MNMAKNTGHRQIDGKQQSIKINVCPFSSINSLFKEV
jgi:hypothetical protein